LFFNLFFRFSSPDDQAVWKQEAILCAISCLRILKAVSSSRCKLQLLLDCLHSIETCISVLENTSVLDQEGKQTSEEAKKVTLESFEAVKKWLKKALLSKIPFYVTAETEKELEVYMLGLFNSMILNSSQ